ncbi:acetylxylan esterase [Mucilaginibacter sp. UYCu711]|uniref:acetylxylan esterase n=1 Tax=Mucilaginibacter sp. UYCu711 TaxID=3156339 RepID=UPI003D23E3A6
MKIRLYLCLCILLGLTRFVSAQVPPGKLVRISVVPDHADWLYKIGEKVKFNVTISQYNVTLSNIKADYQVGAERMPPAAKGSFVSADKSYTIDGGTLKEPGFLRCSVTAEVNGIKYRDLATVGFEPEKIKPMAELPADFKQFWDQGKKELAGTPMENRMTLLPERCTQTVNVYQVNLAGYKGSRVYGILCVPTKAGKFPALLKVPGAGIRPYNGDIGMADKGIITLEIGIHGIPVTMDPGVYATLATGALAGYPNINLDDKDRFYYKRVYLNCIRANDFLVSLPQFDGTTLAVTGGSQGGALSIVTAALDERVTFLAAMYPALCDLTATLKNRAGGWPQYFENANMAFNNKKDKIATCGYYDVVNFAKQLKVPGFYTSGYNDEVCPPSSTFAAYNSITSPKTFVPFADTGHWQYPEQGDLVTKWLLSQFHVK